MRPLVIILVIVALAALAVEFLASNAEARIARRIPGREVHVSVIRMTVTWADLSWMGITAREASLRVPYAAALDHFLSGTPVRAGTVAARDAVLDLSHEVMKPLASTLILGGYGAPTLNVGVLDVQAEAIDGGYRVVRSAILTDIGAFAYAGDIVNGRLANGTLTLSGATPAVEGLMVTMTRLSGGRDQRDDAGLRLTFP